MIGTVQASLILELSCCRDWALVWSCLHKHEYGSAVYHHTFYFGSKEDVAAHHKRANISYREYDRLIRRYDLYQNPFSVFIYLNSLNTWKEFSFYFLAGHTQLWCLSHPGLHWEGQPEPSEENLRVQICGQKKHKLWAHRGDTCLERTISLIQMSKTCPCCDITLGLRDKVGLRPEVVAPLLTLQFTMLNQAVKREEQKLLNCF